MRERESEEEGFSSERRRSNKNCVVAAAQALGLRTGQKWTNRPPFARRAPTAQDRAGIRTPAPPTASTTQKGEVRRKQAMATCRRGEAGAELEKAKGQRHRTAARRQTRERNKPTHTHTLKGKEERGPASAKAEGHAATGQRTGHNTKKKNDEGTQKKAVKREEKARKRRQDNKKSQR